MSFRRFATIGSHPSIPDEPTLEAFERHALREASGAVELDYGWSGGRHILDAEFSFAHNVYNDAFFVGMRVDTNKVPADMKKAWLLSEQISAAKDSPSGFASREQKRLARDAAARLEDQALRDGRFRRSKLSHILWDLPGRYVFAPAGVKASELLGELFSRSHALELTPLGAGEIASRHLEKIGRARVAHDLRPTRFAPSPDGENQQAEYPWTGGGLASRDFLGNEFLLWLWHSADTHSGAVETKDGYVNVLFERMLDLDCAFALSGRDTLRGPDPIAMPEAIDALRSGKVPRKAGLTLERRGARFTFTLAAETFAISSLRLPDIEADDPRVLFEERISMLRDFIRLVDTLYVMFLEIRVGSGWENQASAIRKWITRPARVAAVA